MSARRPAPASDSAFVLHHYDWSETSLILDLFTRERGRVAVVAKGAKRPTSQLRAVLLPFQRIVVSLSTPRAEGESEVLTLRHAEWAAGMALPGGRALLSGFYLNELVMKGLARGEPHPVLFDAYARTLPALSDPATARSAAASGLGESAALAATLRAFELVLLREMGVLPDLARTTLTQQPVALERRYALHPEEGLAAAAEAGAGVPGALWLGAEQALAAGDLEALRALARGAPAALKPQLRAALHYHLGVSSLRSRQALLDVQQLID
jgi:DNA repair protein RecO (recombination protein O)